MNEITGEVQAVLASVRGALDASLEALGARMTEDLISHIEKDFYEADTPNVYQRRRDNPQYGVSIIDTQNISAKVKNGSLEFDYEPSGYHALYGAGISGDSLISRLEHATYDWQRQRPYVPRPFFTNFMQEEFEGRLAAQHLTKALKTALLPLGIEIEGELTIERDGTEPVF